MTLATLVSAAFSAEISPTPISAVEPGVYAWQVSVSIIWYILLAVAMWKVFAKAGRPGILALIPIVNVIILVRITGMSGWLALLYVIPIVNVIFAAVVAFKLGGAFGRGGVFSFFLLWLFAFVGYFIIGFGSSRYTKPVGA